MVKKHSRTEYVTTVAAVTVAIAAIGGLLYTIFGNPADIGINSDGLPEFIHDSTISSDRASLYFKNMGGKNGDFELQILSTDNFQFSNFIPNPQHYTENNPTWEYRLTPGGDVTISFFVQTTKTMANIPENTIYEIRFRLNDQEYRCPYIKTDGSLKRVR